MEALDISGSSLLEYWLSPWSCHLVWVKPLLSWALADAFSAWSCHLVDVKPFVAGFSAGSNFLVFLGGGFANKLGFPDKKFSIAASSAFSERRYGLNSKLSLS